MTNQSLLDAEIMELFAAAFRGIERPDHFTHHTHCDECWEHDEVLRDRTLETLAIEDVGSQAWNPITMATPQGFAYYLPALARLALEPVPKDWDWYGYIILSQLTWTGTRNERWQYCSLNQRSAVCLLLEHLHRTRAESIELYDCENELLEALEVWSDPGV